MPETLYLTTNVLDRYLSTQLGSRSNYQLVGATAMLLASKYEEIWAPKISDFINILENKFEDSFRRPASHMFQLMYYMCTNRVVSELEIFSTS